MPADTPMMQQYRTIKEQVSDCILFFRLGDFYEMFGDDARLASRELDLTLTSRDRSAENEDERVPMCGVPYHSSEAYIARLISRGYKVAVCEQTEDPALAKGLVKRDIIRIITPGTVIDASMLEDGKNNFICAIYEEASAAGICFADISTGQVYATLLTGEDISQRLLNELGRFVPSEAVLSEKARLNEQVCAFLQDRLGCLVELGGEGRFELDAARRCVLEQFQAENPAALGLDGADAAIRALGGLFSYLKETQKADLSHIRTLDFYEKGRFMELDFTARRNLELTQTLRSQEKRGSLLGVLDKTGTAMGGRMLRAWLEKPLLSPAAIGRRLNAVDELVRDPVRHGELALTIRGLPDMERLIGRIVYGTANCRDLRALEQAIAILPRIKEQMKGLCCSQLKEICTCIDTLEDIGALINRAVVDEPPFSLREGGFIRTGYHAEVDRLRAIMTDGRGTVAAMEAAEREKTGVRTLKVGYNKVFGYYIEVSRSYLGQVPDTYIRKQTLSNCERYITQELKEMESTILGAQERITGLEYELFCALREQIAVQVHRVQRTASAVAQLDVLASFAEVARKNSYCMPTVDYSDVIDIREGRHPVVEHMLENRLFVPNDTNIDCGENCVAIITGPNMAGKSTYMRQVALIVLMAQVGSFVPAKSARIGVVDRIFTRIGASDDLASGQSTFMVEMTEVADILKNATHASLLILDEIGRGTSTFDGMSIARAVLEYTADKKLLGAKTLFATHYHELTELEEQLTGVKNYNIAVKKRGDDIIFLRKIVRGGADDSYGIEVAKLAGVPQKVISRAKTVLEALEAGAPVDAVKARRAAGREESQVSMLDLSANEITEQLKTVDVNTLTPIEALNLLNKLHNKAKNG